MHTTRSLTISHRIICKPPCNHAHPLATMPPATMHTPHSHACSPCNHACPPTMQAPYNHAHPTCNYTHPCNHACPPQPCMPCTTTYAPPPNHVPPYQPCMPLATTHPPQPHTPSPPPGNHAPPCGQNCWHTLLKILPCPKLRLRAVLNNGSFNFSQCREYQGRSYQRLYKNFEKKI